MLTALITKITKTSPTGFTYPTQDNLHITVQTDNALQLIPAENYDTQVFADYDACVLASKDAVINSTGYVFRELCASPDQSVIFTAIYMASEADAIAVMATCYTQDFVNKRTAFGNCISATFETRMVTNFMETSFEKINEAFDSGTVVAVA